MKPIKLLAILFCFISTPVSAVETQSLVLKTVSKNVWAIVGPLTNRSKENLGNNATFGFVVTNDGVVLIDAGGSYKGAEALHQIIKTVTDKPVKYVINTGGQDHRWFGNDYFARLGAKIISSKAAKKDHKMRSDSQWTMLESRIGKDGIKGTQEKYADIVFANEYQFSYGDFEFEIYHRGQAHTPGDAYVWLPQSKVMFSGDIVYTERMLSIAEQSNSRSWLEAFDTMAAFKPEHVVPGHGSPTTLEKAIKDTRNYLIYLREAVSAFMENEGEAQDIDQVKQTQFNYLNNYEALKGSNALKVYSELEWE